MITCEIYPEMYEKLIKHVPLLYKIIHGKHGIQLHPDGYKVYYCCGKCFNSWKHFSHPVSDDVLRRMDELYKIYQENKWQTKIKPTLAWHNDWKCTACGGDLSIVRGNMNIGNCHKCGTNWVRNCTERDVEILNEI